MGMRKSAYKLALRRLGNCLFRVAFKIYFSGMLPLRFLITENLFSNENEHFSISSTQWMEMRKCAYKLALRRLGNCYFQTVFISCFSGMLQLRFLIPKN